MSKSQFDIEEWIKNSTGDFHLNDIMVQLQIASEDYGHLRKAMHRVCERGIAKSLGRRDGWYRAIDKEYDILNFKGKNPEGFFPIKYPFGLEDYFKTPRRSIVVVAGSPDSGKTAVAHNLVHLNWQNHKVVLWDSENSDAELEERISAFEDYMDWPDDLIRSRSGNFDDIIEPNALNIIDYLELPEKIWEIGKDFRRIRDKLDKGIAVVNLQKPEGRDLPYGREWSKQLPRVVLSMEGGILKILKGKSWMNKDVNPVGLRWSFKLHSGECFSNIMPLGKENK